MILLPLLHFSSNKFTVADCKNYFQFSDHFIANIIASYYDFYYKTLEMYETSNDIGVFQKSIFLKAENDIVFHLAEVCHATLS